MMKNNKHRLIISANRPYYQREDISPEDAFPQQSARNNQVMQKQPSKPAKHFKSPSLNRRAPAHNIAQKIPVHIGMSNSHVWDNNSVMGEFNDVNTNDVQGHNPLEHEEYYVEHEFTQRQNLNKSDYNVHSNLEESKQYNPCSDLEELEYCVLLYGNLVFKSSDHLLVENFISDLILNEQDIQTDDFVVLRRLPIKYGVFLSG